MYNNFSALFQSTSLRMWEDTSQSYCILKIASLYKKNVIIFIDKLSNEYQISYIKRYISNFNSNALYFFVYYNLAGNIIFIENKFELFQCIEDKNFVILKYKSGIYSKQFITYDENYQFLDNISYDLHLPEYKMRNEQIFNFYYNDIKKQKYIYDCLCDNESRNTLCEILRVAAENDIYRLPERPQSSKYFECYKPLDKEIWINCGSCFGDTILCYLEQNRNFKRIFAIEGNNKNFDILKNNIELLPAYISKKIVIMNRHIGTDNNMDNLDNVFKHIQISFINMDIEGYEMPVLRGAANIIKNKRPVLAISAYHNASDLFDIPKFINSIVDNYQFYLRKYIGFTCNALNEFIYYCIPIERVLTEGGGRL